jgi:hypothetical protein
MAEVVGDGSYLAVNLRYRALCSRGADERVIRRAPGETEPRDRDRCLAREGPDAPAREIIFAERPVLCVCRRALDSCGRRIPCPILRGSLRHLEGVRIPQMGYLFLAHLG